jgi:hypothetical protein
MDGKLVIQRSWNAVSHTSAGSASSSS